MSDKQECRGCAELGDEVERLRILVEVRRHSCECSEEDACNFVRQRDEALAQLSDERLRRGRETARVAVFMQAMAWLARNGQKARGSAWVNAADVAAASVRPEDFVRIAAPVRKGKQ